MKLKSLKTQFIGAIAMVLVAAIAMGSSTYAWFAMNSTVTANNMSVVAAAEAGIVISNSDKTNWTSTAGSTTGNKSLLPTNTDNATVWFHSSSTDANAKHAGDIPYAYVVQGTGLYELTKDSTFQDGKTYYTTTDGVTFTSATVTTGNAVTASTYYELSADTRDYYAVNEFHIRSSTTSALTNKSLKVSRVSITTTTANSTLLNNSVRVLVKIGNTAYIYRLAAEDTGAYAIGNTGRTYTAIEAGSGLDNQFTSEVTSIPANSDANGVTAYVYIYYEGESNYSISNNLATSTDTLAVEVDFTAFDYTP